MFIRWINIKLQGLMFLTKYFVWIILLSSIALFGIIDFQQQNKITRLKIQVQKLQDKNSQLLQEKHDLEKFIEDTNGDIWMMDARLIRIQEQYSNLASQYYTVKQQLDKISSHDKQLKQYTTQLESRIQSISDQINQLKNYVQMTGNRHYSHTKAKGERRTKNAEH